MEAPDLFTKEELNEFTQRVYWDVEYCRQNRAHKNVMALIDDAVERMVNRGELRRVDGWQKVKQILPRIWRYYKENHSGGSLRLVLEDGNCDLVDICLKYARLEGDAEGEAIALELLTWTEAEVEELYSRYEEYSWDAPEPKP